MKDEFPMRLAKFLASRGVASRRKSEELVAAGRVEVNGETVSEPGAKVAESDKVTVDGGPPLRARTKIYVMLNKPRGYLCSASDPHADKTVFDLVDIPGERLFTVGRLDLDSEGLVLLTNDGDFAEKVAHPRYGVLKRYELETTKRVSDADLERMRKGVEDDGEFLKPVSVKRLPPKNGRKLQFTMSEGKKREIRRIVMATGNRVKRLKRLSIGKLELGNLPKGEWRKISREKAREAAETARA